MSVTYRVAKRPKNYNLRNFFSIWAFFYEHEHDSQNSRTAGEEGNLSP